MLHGKQKNAIICKSTICNFKLLHNQRDLEQFVAQFVDGSSVDEGLILHDVEQTVAHFDLNTHLEPLVVDVEAGTDFSSHIEAFGDQVVDELVALSVGLLVVFLRGQVDFRVDAAHQVSTDVVVTFRTVFDVEREFDEGGADRLGEGFHGDFAIQVFDSDIVTHASLAEAQRGDETQVEIATKAFAANDAHGETRRLQGLNVVDIEVLRDRDVVVAIGPRVGGLGDILVVLNSLNGIHHLVVSQQESEMVRLLLVFGQVVDDPSLGLGGDDRRDE